jgi:hypothetical protein
VGGETRVHTWYFVVNFYHQVVEEQQRANAGRGIASTLHMLCLLFALDRVNAEAALFLEYDYITGISLSLAALTAVLVCWRPGRSLQRVRSCSIN